MKLRPPTCRIVVAWVLWGIAVRERPAFLWAAAPLRRLGLAPRAQNALRGASPWVRPGRPRRGGGWGPCLSRRRPPRDEKHIIIIIIITITIIIIVVVVVIVAVLVAAAADAVVQGLGFTF